MHSRGKICCVKMKESPLIRLDFPTANEIKEQNLSRSVDKHVNFPLLENDFLSIQNYVYFFILTQ